MVLNFSMKYSMPAEWAPHSACWVAWPSHADLWLEDLEPVQEEFVALCRAIQFHRPGTPVETLKVLAPNPDRLEEARMALKGLKAEFFEIGFGDIWLRDTAPVFLESKERMLTAGCFQFNGWGGKYALPFDHEVSRQISEVHGGPSVQFDWVLEGGSIEVDGEGTCLTTEQCLLSPNRNPKLSREAIEKKLQEALGVQKVLWIREGLINDHTDGHIDTLARFVSPSEVVCMRPTGKNDPNAETLREIETVLLSMRDAAGRPLKVHTIPSPGKVQDETGKILPASYVNFYISNTSVVVPTYGASADTDAVQALKSLFPHHEVMGSPAKHLLRGGGAFHCITQQEPTYGK
jgi:agmatine deiminase